MKLLRNLFMSAAVGGMILACNNDGMEPQGKIGGGAISECGCVESYDALDNVLSFDQGIKVDVDVSSDGTSLSYKVYREDNGQIGNIKVDGVSQGGGTENFYNITKSLSGVATCATVNTTVRVVGANGRPVFITLTYVNKPLCGVVTDPLDCSLEETAFGSGTNGPTTAKNRAWWYYYTAGSGPQTIYAGQNVPVGSVIIEEVDGVREFTISLTNGWQLKPGTESVKIQGYTSATLPKSRPAAGLFTTYKDSGLTGPLATFPYYVIHLDVQRCVPITMP